MFGGSVQERTDPAALTAHNIGMVQVCTERAQDKTNTYCEKKRTAVDEGLRNGRNARRRGGEARETSFHSVLKGSAPRRWMERFVSGPEGRSGRDTDRSLYAVI